MKKILLIPVLLLIAGNIYAQITWHYTEGYMEVGGGTFKDTTYNKVNMSTFEAIQFHPEDIYHWSANIGGVIADINTGGEVVVRVHLFDPYKTDNIGPTLYSCSSSTTSTTYNETALTITEQASDRSGDPIWTNFYNNNEMTFKNARSSLDIRKTSMAALEAWKVYTQGSPKLYNVIQNSIPVIITIEVTNATVKRVKIPGIGDFAPFDAFFEMENDINDITDVFKHPNQHPDYVMVAAHRGYFRDVPDNSLEALRLAIGLQVPMVEVDVQLSKDNIWMLSHDAKIGQTDRTLVPARLQNSTNDIQIPISDLTLCDMRPDLCDNSCPYGATSGSCEPVWLKQQGLGTGKVPIPTNEAAMFLCKQKVLYDMDKIDKGGNNMDTRFDLIWEEVKEMGLQYKAIVKGKNWADPASLITAFPDVKWDKLMYTPTYFPEATISSSILTAWTTNNNFDCPGFELIYYDVGDPVYQQIAHARSLNKHVIQFPMWPEYPDHIITDARIDHRNSWNWLLDDKDRRPSLIISDRLEVLLQLLTTAGLQNF